MALLHRFAPVGSLIAVLGLVSCGGDEDTEPVSTELDEVSDAVDAGPDDAGFDAGFDAGPPRPPARLFARRFVSKIREEPDRDSFRIGYLRRGAIVMATTGNPVVTGDRRCRGGWYELTTGGFVCNGSDVIAFWGRRPPEARGAQPDRDAPLPYDYGRTRGENTPMYRNLPNDEQAAEFEGFRIPGQEPEPAPALEGDAPPAAPSSGELPAEPATPPPSPAPAVEAPPDPAPAAPPDPAPAAPPDPAPLEEPEEEPQVTLESLQGESDSILLRRLVNGFIVSLDRDFRAGPSRRRYWRTIANGFVPYRTVAPVTYPEFQGGRLDDGAQLPVGYVTTRSGVSYLPTESGRPRRGTRADFQHRVHIIGEETHGANDYFVGADNRMYETDDVRRIEACERPDGVGENDKWIEVNLSRQYVIAYEGDTPVYVTLISSGRAFHPDDPEADFLTPTGLFRIRAKHLAATMDGDTAADGPYSIDDVPWVMYFELAYALHGAFWHRAFGFPRSHGCVNLAPRDAQWIFNWSDPQLPEGWHGVYPTEDGPGTWIYIHGETPGSRSH